MNAHHSILLILLASVGLLISCRTAKEPAPAATPEAEDEPVEEPEAATPTAEPAEPACVPPLDWEQLDACLAQVAPEGDGWTKAPEPYPPEGYFCAFFGTRGPACVEGEATAFASWGDAADEGCRRTMTVHRAPLEAPTAPPTEEVPGSALRIRYFDTDGRHYAWIRVEDHVVEATSCANRQEESRSDAVRWATALKVLAAG